MKVQSGNVYSDQNAISKRLRQARSNAGYRFAKDFSDSIDVPYITYSQHESGKRSIKPEQLLLYVEKLGITLEWILTGNEHVKQRLSQQIDSELLLDIYDQLIRVTQSMNIIISERHKFQISCSIYNAFRSQTNSDVGLFKIIVDHLSELSPQKNLA